jgi:hypothetical protein
MKIIIFKNTRHHNKISGCHGDLIYRLFVDPCVKDVFTLLPQQNAG